jgi:hypothetical protein
MYFNATNANKALEILAAAGFAAEIVTASRPNQGPWTRYLLNVEAPHLPRLNGKVQTVQLRTPQELMGWGAVQTEVDEMNRLERFAA